VSVEDREKSGGRENLRKGQKNFLRDKRKKKLIGFISQSARI
jgi:hypothetical protein